MLEATSNLSDGQQAISPQFGREFVDQPRQHDHSHSTDNCPCSAPVPPQVHTTCQTIYGWEYSQPAQLLRTGTTQPCATCALYFVVNAGDRWRINFSRVHWNVTWSEGQQRWVKDPPDQPGYNFVWSSQWQVQMHQPETWGWLQFSTTPGKLHVLPQRGPLGTLGLFQTLWVSPCLVALLCYVLTNLGALACTETKLGVSHTIQRSEVRCVDGCPNGALLTCMHCAVTQAGAI